MNGCNDSGASAAYFLKATEPNIQILFEYWHQIFERQNKMNSTILSQTVLLHRQHEFPVTSVKASILQHLTLYTKSNTHQTSRMKLKTKILLSNQFSVQIQVLQP
jgi:hypothetical protein